MVRGSAAEATKAYHWYHPRNSASLQSAQVCCYSFQLCKRYQGTESIIAFFGNLMANGGVFAF